MTNKIDKRFRLLKGILENSCPDRFTMSGDKGRALDCFVVYYNLGEPEEFLLKRVDNEGIHGLKWKNEKFEIEAVIDPIGVDYESLQIEHYWHGNTIRFNGISDYNRHQITKYIYVKLWIYNKFHIIRKYLFHKRKLASPSRMKLLSAVMNLSLDNPNRHLSRSDITLSYFGRRYYGHPQMTKFMEMIKLLLESLIESNDLAKQGDRYILQGKALATLQEYESTLKKEKYLSRIQFGMFLFTFVMAVTGIVQLYGKYFNWW